MIADEEAFEYFRLKNSEVFSSREEFDGVQGLLAYNRTDQEKGKATIFNPVNEWIVSVGKHPGIILGKVWVAVQDNLEQNKSKAYRRPCKNEALLTGLVFCACCNRMYPRLSKRTTANGEYIYTYVCKMKERSKRELCKRHNAYGNTLDTAIIEQLKLLADEKTIMPVSWKGARYSTPVIVRNMSAVLPLCERKKPSAKRMLPICCQIIKHTEMKAFLYRPAVRSRAVLAFSDKLGTCFFVYGRARANKVERR